MSDDHFFPSLLVPVFSFIWAELTGGLHCGSLYLARDHLANERTYLAYLRTSLAIASTGVGEPQT